MDHQTDEILYVCRAVVRGDAGKESVKTVARRLISQLEEDEKELTGERKVERLRYDSLDGGKNLSPSMMAETKREMDVRKFNAGDEAEPVCDCAGCAIER